ncbi:sucrose-phosphatase-like protein [Thalictrum thalictroides]|uniref:Sucrose-phosphatase-like protein n=1 Tax=Thalictrum thalictroides TaxID=46969 RepID=A0A7J6X2W7_THATH|nr:sucrose-phosphatase-like protein [Thalictrum thalictroides]
MFFYNCGRICFELQISSELSLLYPRYGDRFLKHSLHSSSSEEDDFAELDLPVKEGPAIHSKLMTEKTKEKVRSNYSRKAKSSSKLQGKDNPIFKSLSRENDNRPPDLCCVGESRTEISDIEKDTEDSAIIINTKSVTIEKVPTKINLTDLKNALSEFGEILNASISSETDGFSTCYVEFKTLESKERAVASGGIIVKLSHLPIRSLCIPENTVCEVIIRIKNIKSDAAEPAIHSTCLLCGPVKGLSRTKEGYVDVVFGVKKISAGKEIVDKLNVLCADNGWLVEILLESADSTLMDISAETSKLQQVTGSELANLLEDALRHYQLQKIFLDDLLKLHQAVVHLQNRPTC